MTGQSDAQAAAVLALRATGLSHREISRALGVAKSRVATICRGAPSPVREDIPDLPIRGRCMAPLPALPPLVLGQSAGARVLALMAHVLAPADNPSQ